MSLAGNPPRPNLFLVGAPKCATTAMHAWLSQHPEIFMSRLKEPQFFAEDVLGHQRNVTTMEAYLRCFENAGEKKIVGEASTSYMVSSAAAGKIKQFSPDACILVMLRNPVDVMFALHNLRVFSGSEHITDFATAIGSSEPRIWRSGPWKAQPVVRRPYREVVKFACQLNRYFETFGRDRVHVVIHDDLCRCPSVVWEQVQDFVGVSRVKRDDFAPKNLSRRVRAMNLQDWLRRPTGTLRQAAHALLPARARRGVGEWLRAMNSAPDSRRPLGPSFRQRLADECAEDIEALSQLLGRDLTSWTGPAKRPALSAQL